MEGARGEFNTRPWCWWCLALSQGHWTFVCPHLSEPHKAVKVALLQGHLLSKLGIAWSLTAVPAISVLLMSAMALQPSVAIVGLADVLRKVGALETFHTTCLHSTAAPAASAASAALPSAINHGLFGHCEPLSSSARGECHQLSQALKHPSPQTHNELSHQQSQRESCMGTWSLAHLVLCASMTIGSPHIVCYAVLYARICFSVLC